MTSFVSHFVHMFSHLKFSRFLTFCLTYLHHWRNLTETPKDQVVEHTGSPEVTGNHRDSHQHDTMVAKSTSWWFISWFIGFQHVSTIQNWWCRISQSAVELGVLYQSFSVTIFFLELAQEADPFLGEHRNGVGDLKRVSYVTIWLWLTVRHGKIHPFLMGKP